MGVAAYAREPVLHGSSLFSRHEALFLLLALLAMFFDLNLGVAEQGALPALLDQEIKLGYSAIALTNFVAGRIQSEHACKIAPVTSPTGFVTQSGAPLRQYTRLTVRLEDPAHLHSMAATNPVFKSYDIVAVQPMTDKVWEKCTKDLGADCMRVAETHPELDVDIITFDLTQRLPVQLKIPKVREAIKRGIYFEINYSAALIDPAQRRSVIGNALNLVRMTGGRNIIFSSNARKVMDIRGPYDVANLGILFGVKQDQALAAVSANCASVIAHGQTRKSIMGVFTIVPRASLPASEEWKLDTTMRTPPPPQTAHTGLLGGEQKKKKKKMKKKSTNKQEAKDPKAEKSGGTTTEPVIRGISASLTREKLPAPAPKSASATHKRKSSKGSALPDAQQQPQKRAASSEKDTDSDMGSAVRNLQLRNDPK